MKIYRGIIEVLDLGFEPEGTERKELMVEHTISFSFELQTYIKLEKGDSITYNGKKFYLKDDCIPTVNKSTNGFVYDLKFYDIMERMKDIKLKYNGDTDFKLTVTGGQFLDVVVSSFSGLTKGSFPTGIKEIHFENLSVFDALNLITETYDTEWWLNGSTLNLSKCEFGAPVLLRLDTELDDISVSQSSETLVTRLYAKGSTRNIPKGYSKDNRLKLASGYIDLIPDLPESKIIEGVHIFEDIYPRQTTSIVEVIQGSVGDTPIFTIRGNNAFTITQNDVLSGQPLKIAFNSGNLSGREFELIIRENNYFEIKYIQDGELVIPNLTLKPEVGDEFFFFNFNIENVLPALIELAEEELLTVSREYLDNLGGQLVYNCVTRTIYCEENYVDLEVGQIVTIQSETIGIVLSRVRGYTKQLFNKYESTYQVGNYSSYSRLGQIEKETSKKADKEEIVEIKDNTGEIKNIVQNLDSKFLSKINPDTAQGLITFLGGLTSTTADIEDLKADKGDIKSLTSATAIIDNITLHKGMSSEIFFPGFLGEGMELFKDEDGNWNFTLDNLTVRKQMNVFELVINKIKHVGGAFLFSPAGGTFIGVEEHDTFWRCYVEDKNNNEFEIYDQVICQTFTKNRLKRYWRLAVNIGEDFVDLSKTDCESGSAYPEIDDEAVVLGNRINKARQNAVLISSYGDDGSYQQFLNGVDTYSLADKIDIHFGKESFMRVNRLEIKGTDGKSERVPRDRGIFQSGETYEFYDRVVYNGRYWLCLAINTTSAPSEGEWQEQTNVRAGGKNLLREHDLRFDGKYWQGSYDSQFIDLSMLSDYLFNGNNDAIVTEGNIYIEL